MAAAGPAQREDASVLDGLKDEFHRMPRGAIRAVLDLLAAGNTGRRDDDVRSSVPYGREETSPSPTLIEIS